MTKKSSIFILLATLILTYGCTETNKKESLADKEKTEMKYPMESVMINKTQCELYGEYKDLKVEDIFGVWQDSLFWKMQPDDSCYYGVNELDVNVELEIKPTKTFRQSFIYSKPKYDRVREGEYFLSFDSGVTTLILADNPKGEVLFEQGDTMKNSVVYKLRWIDNNTMILDSKVEKNKYKLREAIEYKKTTR